MGHTIEIAEFLLLNCRRSRGARQPLAASPTASGWSWRGSHWPSSRFRPNYRLLKDLIFTTLLPPLVFEAAFQLPWKPLRRDFPVILLLATLGVLLAAALTAAGMHYIAGWTWMAALVFGVLIAATDPVSVIATFKESGIRGRLRLLVEAESLFNDGTAAVAFGIAVAIGHRPELLGASISRARSSVTAGGGILCGRAGRRRILLLAGRTEDHLIELTFTTVAAYGSFLLAEHFHLSGILATVTAGIMLGNLGQLGAITDKGREAVEAFWEFAAFVANSLIFLLLGLQLAHQSFSAVWRPAAAAIVIVMLGRALAVYPICWLFSRSALRVEMETPESLVLGRIARGTGAGAGSRTPARDAAPRRYNYRQFCSGRFLHFSAGPDHSAATAKRTGAGTRFETLMRRTEARSGRLCYIKVSCSSRAAIITDPIITTGIPCRDGLIRNHKPISDRFESPPVDPGGFSFWAKICMQLDFKKLDGLLPAVIQDDATGRVLMVGFMNEEAFRKTVETGFATFYSRSRNKLWLKGESSGHRLVVKDISTDCDLDTVLVKVEALGPGVCHEGYQSCFFRRLENGEWKVSEERDLRSGRGL